MADDDDKHDKKPEAAPTVFVKGGTTSFGHDMEIRRREADAEARRNEADRQKAALAMGAKLYANNLTERPEVPEAHVLLRYLTNRGEPMYDHGTAVECLADIVMLDPKKPEDLTLILVCPSCKAKGLPQGQCQIQIRQSNRPWHLDVSKAGAPVVFEGKVYYSAGEVCDGERFTCPNCPWSARIDRNRVWPD